MIKVAVVVGSTRPGRKALVVAEWVHGIGKKRSDVELELVDLATFNLPLLDEATPPSMGKYTQPHTKAWAAKVAEFDGYVFVTPEYNHGPSAALKNALDFVYAEWNNKSAGFVGYGSAGGARAVEQLRLVMGELQIADVRAQVMLSLATDFEKSTTFTPAERHVAGVEKVFDQVIAWGGALKTLRQNAV